MVAKKSPGKKRLRIKVGKLTLNKEKDKEDKLKKKKPEIDQMRPMSSTRPFKVVLVTWLPFIAVYYLMANFVGGFSAAVAY